VLRNLPLVLLSLLALSGCNLGLSLEGKNVCETDSDCLGSRVCEARECVDHASGNDGTNAPADGGANHGGQDETDGGHGGGTNGEATPNGGSNPNNDGSNPSNGDTNNGGDAGMPECRDDEDCEHGTCQSGTCATVVPRIVPNDTVWRAEDSPYWLAQNTQVGGVLTIEKGVTLIGNDHRMKVFDRLAVVGAKNDRVVFDHVHLDSTPDARFDIQFAHFVGGDLYAPGYGEGGSIRLRDSILEGTGKLYLHYVGSSTIARNRFIAGTGQLSIGASDGILIEVTNNYFDIQPAEGQNEPGTPASSILIWAGDATNPAQIHRNTFADTGVIGVALEGDGAAEAVENYWSTNAPSTIERMIWDRNDSLDLAVKIPYAPILSTHDPLTPAPGREWPAVDEPAPCLVAGCTCDRKTNPCYGDLTCVASTCQQGDFFGCDRSTTDSSCTQYVGSEVAKDSNLDQVCDGERTAACPTAKVAGHCASYEGQPGEVVTTYYAGAAFTQTDCESAGGRWY